MLAIGRTRAGGNWHWAACGKHPLAADYFRLNVTTPLQQAFESWVAEGFAALPEKAGAHHEICSWRFWSKGGKKGCLACGLLKASSDRMGRPYPLLMVGEGYIGGWEEKWAHLPHFLKAGWHQMEDIASRRFDDLSGFEKALRSLKSSLHEWPAEFRNKAATGEGLAPEAVAAGGGINFAALEPPGDAGRWMIKLDQRHLADEDTAPQRLGGQLAKQGVVLPNALFIGGSPKQQFLVVFNRSLQTRDFVHLWSVGKGRREGEGSESAIFPLS